MSKHHRLFRNIFCLILTFSLLLLPTGCGKNRSSDAVSYLEQTSEEELIELIDLAACTQIHPANSVREGFSSPADLSSADLYNLFEVKVEQSTLNQYLREDNQYHIPVSTISAFLENYFLTFQFNPASLISDGRSITLEENGSVLVTPGIVGFPANIVDFLTIETVDILSSDSLSVTAVYQWPEDPSPVRYTLSLQIADGHPYLEKLEIEQTPKEVNPHKAD